MALPSFTPTGTIYDIVGVESGELTAAALSNARIVFTPNVSTSELITWEGEFYRLNPVVATLDDLGTIGTDTRLLANDPGLNLDGLQWQVQVRVGLSESAIKPWWFDAPADGTTTDLSTVARVPGVAVQGTAGLPAQTGHSGEFLTTDGSSASWTEVVGGGGGSGANLSVSRTGTQVVVASDSGTDATILAADGSNAGVMTVAMQAKLSGIATGATANSADATLLARANHTGSQLSTTISDFTEAVQDAVAAVLVAGTNVTVTYNDVANTITVAASGSGGLDAEAVRDAIGTALVGAGVITVTVNDGADTITISTTATVNSSDATLLARANHTGTQVAATISDMQETVEDIIGTKVVAGSNVTVTYNDSAGTTTIASSGGGGGYTPGGTDVALSDGGTGTSLTDPNADRIMFWDDSAGAVTWLTPGSGLSLTGTTLTATASGGILTPEQYGAVGNGSTDDTTALNNCFAAAAGRTVILDATKIYVHNAPLTIGQEGTTVTGGGELRATDAAEGESGVLITGDNVLMDHVLLTCPSAVTRRDTMEDHKLSVQSDGVTLRRVTVTSSAASGIFFAGASNYVVESCVVSGTLADAFHNTEGSHDGSFVNCVARDSGDDGFAVVSYLADSAMCSDISTVGCQVYAGGARGFAVVGGTRIHHSDIYVNDSDAAAVYVARESSYNSYDSTYVTIDGGTIIDGNTGFASVGHGAIIVVAGGTGTVQYVNISNLDVRDTPAGAPCVARVLSYDPAVISDVLISNVQSANGPTDLLDIGGDGTLTRIYTVGCSADGGVAETVLRASGARTLRRDIPLNVATGTTNTWTLPPMDGHLGVVFSMKNSGSGNLTVQRAGSDQIYTTSAVTSYTIAAGGSGRIFCDGTYWVTA